MPRTAGPRAGRPRPGAEGELRLPRRDPALPERHPGHLGDLPVRPEDGLPIRPAEPSKRPVGPGGELRVEGEAVDTAGCQYRGLDRFVKVSYVQPGIDLSYIGPSGTHTFDW